MNNGKMLGRFGVVLVIAWFVKGNLRLTVAIFPHYWVSKAYETND